MQVQDVRSQPSTALGVLSFPASNAGWSRRQLLRTAAASTAGWAFAWPPRSGAAAKPTASSETPASGWWAWRGPGGNNIVPTADFAAGPITPERVLWQTPIPGRGHSSPIVTDQTIYLTTADPQAGTQSLLALDRASGKPLWDRIVHRGGIPTENHRKNTEASPTPAFDGQRLLVAFYNDDAIRLSAYTPAGMQLWQRAVGRYQPQRYQYGYAASPAIDGDRAIIAGEFDGPAFLAAISLETGEELWRSPRPKHTSYSSPIVAHVAGRRQCLISGSEKISSYDPESGKLLWQAPASATATCGTIVWDEDKVYASGGFPQSETACVRADGSGQVLWTNNQKCYEQSMLLTDGHLYAVTDQGIAHCWRGDDGTLQWRQRLGGNYSSSPILVGDIIHVLNEAGQTFSFRADPTRFDEVGRAQIGDEGFATPAVVGDTMYLRTARTTPETRQEYLLALR